MYGAPTAINPYPATAGNNHGWMDIRLTVVVVVIPNHPAIPDAGTVVVTVDPAIPAAAVTAVLRLPAAVE